MFAKAYSEVKMDETENGQSDDACDSDILDLEGYTFLGLTSLIQLLESCLPRTQTTEMTKKTRSQ
jgi:hypothetical protein